MLIELIVRALPDMSLNELSQLESAVNAEIQDRYHAQQDEYFNAPPELGGPQW